MGLPPNTCRAARRSRLLESIVGTQTGGLADSHSLGCGLTSTPRFDHLPVFQEATWCPAVK